MPSFLQRFSKVSFLTALVLLVGWLVSIRGFTAYRDAFGTPIGPDFLQFYTGATLFLHDQGSALYDFHLQISTESEILHSPQEYLHPYIYPPLLAWILQPLALLDYRIAFGIWTLGGVLLLWQIGRRFGFGLPFGWFPVFAALSYGQNSFLSLGALALVAWLWMEKEKPLWAGLAAGFLLYKPQLFVALVPGFLILKEWRVIQGMVISGLIFLLVSFTFVPSETFAYRTFALEEIPRLIAVPGFPITQFFDSKGFIRLLFPHSNPMVQTLFSLGILVFFLFAFKNWIRSIPVENKRLRMAGFILLLPWTNPYFLVYDWTLLLIAYGLLKKERTLLDDPKNQKWVPLIWMGGLLSYPLAAAMMSRWGFALQIAPIVLALMTYRFYGIGFPLVSQYRIQQAPSRRDQAQE